MPLLKEHKYEAKETDLICDALEQSEEKSTTTFEGKLVLSFLGAYKAAQLCKAVYDLLFCSCIMLFLKK